LAFNTNKSYKNIKIMPEHTITSLLKNIKIEYSKITSVQNFPSTVIENKEKNTVINLPPRTVVKLLIQPEEKSNIQVELSLPDPRNWHKKFLGLGNGGAAGNINTEVFLEPLSRGFAAATTDMGTAPSPDSGIQNIAVWKDFGYRATHLMTVVSKQIIEIYYGILPEFSYFSGVSTGGQQALQEAQRYPEDYDGIIAGLPAHSRVPLHAYFLWNEQILNKCPFSEQQQKNIIAGANEYMAPKELPQIAGKFISDPRCSTDDLKTIIKIAKKRDNSLTRKHINALWKLFDGPTHKLTGERIFNGIPPGSSFDIAHGHLYLFKWVFGKDKSIMDINFAEDIDFYAESLVSYLNAENHNISKFKKNSGKLIIFSGSADSCVPYHATLDYYERVIEHCGSLEEAKSFSRFYIIPGASHGSSSPGINKIPDFLELLIQWREKEIAPDFIKGLRIIGNEVEMEIPIYPYPLKPLWDPKSKTFKSFYGSRGGIERISKRFRI